MPSRSFGIFKSMLPTRVSQRRVRYPFRRLIRSGDTTPYGAPHTSSASADISVSAKVCTISRSRSGSADSSCVRSHSFTSILSLITASLLTSRAMCREAGAVITYKEGPSDPPVHHIRGLISSWVHGRGASPQSLEVADLNAPTRLLGRCRWPDL